MSCLFELAARTMDSCPRERVIYNEVSRDQYNFVAGRRFDFGAIRIGRSMVGSVIGGGIRKSHMESGSIP